ncbi:MAG: PD-(D/E)XK nuclease family protein [Anaerolineae bacterium]|nr:PD-(D/E)XK nuclease family protein [Anaerolineae bacterium]
MFDKALIEELLAQVKRLQREHAARAQQERRAFNIFTMLRPEDDEVNLHSRFLFELLNPQGTHGMGTAFLERFLAQAGLDGFDVTTATVKREYQNMDIFIANRSRQAIILENKVYAPDQPGQLARYYKAIRKEGYKDVVVVYLSLYGDPPDEKSAGNLDEEVSVFSYASDVRNWVEACIGAAEAYPVIRETLIQYQWLIDRLTGQEGGSLLIDVKNLLKDEETLAAAIGIGQALAEIKIDVQFAFWTQLEKRFAQAGFEILEYWKYSLPNVQTFYKKKGFDRGLMMRLPELAEQEVLAMYIGAYPRVYYGFMTLEEGAPAEIAREIRFAPLVAILKTMDTGWSVSDRTVGWRPTRRKFDFHAFNTPDTMALIDPAKRDAYLDELVEEVMVAIDRFYTECEKTLSQGGDSEW